MVFYYIIFSSETSISEIFAIIRQWAPQVQQNLETFVNEVVSFFLQTVHKGVIT